MSEDTSSMGELVDDLVGVDPDEVAAAKSKLPDSSFFKAGIIGVLVFAGAIIGKPELSSTPWVDAAVSAYTVAAPIVLAWWLNHQHKAITAITTAADSTAAAPADPAS